MMRAAMQQSQEVIVLKEKIHPIVPHGAISK